MLENVGVCSVRELVALPRCWRVELVLRGRSGSLILVQAVVSEWRRRDACFSSCKFEKIGGVGVSPNGLRLS